MTQQEAFEKIQNHLIGYIHASGLDDFGFDEKLLNAQEYGVVADMMDYVTEMIRTMPLE